MWCKDISSLHTQNLDHMDNAFPPVGMSLVIAHHVRSLVFSFLRQKHFTFTNSLNMYYRRIPHGSEKEHRITMSSKITIDFHHTDMFNITSASTRPLLLTLVRNEGYLCIRSGARADFSTTRLGTPQRGPGVDQQGTGTADSVQILVDQVWVAGIGCPLQDAPISHRMLCCNHKIGCAISRLACSF